jgi:hypothetical protein
MTMDQALHVSGISHTFGRQCMAYGIRGWTGDGLNREIFLSAVRWSPLWLEKMRLFPIKCRHGSSGDASR